MSSVTPFAGITHNGERIRGICFGSILRCVSNHWVGVKRWNGLWNGQFCVQQTALVSFVLCTQSDLSRVSFMQARQYMYMYIEGYKICK